MKPVASGMTIDEVMRVCNSQRASKVVRAPVEGPEGTKAFSSGDPLVATGAENVGASRPS